jgi:hypothetical protein
MTRPRACFQTLLEAPESLEIPPTPLKKAGWINCAERKFGIPVTSSAGEQGNLIYERKNEGFNFSSMTINPPCQPPLKRGAFRVSFPPFLRGVRGDLRV